MEPGSWPSGVSLKRNVAHSPRLARTVTRILLMALSVTHRIYHHHRVIARKLSLWIDFFLMKLQALPPVPSPRAQGGGYKVSLAPFCTLTTFRLRMTEPLWQHMVYKLGHRWPAQADDRRGKRITKRRNGRSREVGRVTIRNVV